jgi:hypothetical protein
MPQYLHGAGIVIGSPVINNHVGYANLAATDDLVLLY